MPSRKESGYLEAAMLERPPGETTWRYREMSEEQQRQCSDERDEPGPIPDPSLGATLANGKWRWLSSHLSYRGVEPS